MKMNIMIKSQFYSPYNLVFMSGNSWPRMVVLLYYLKTVGIHWIFIGLLVNEGRADIENYASCIVALVCSRHNHPEFVRKLGIECVYIKFLLFKDLFHNISTAFCTLTNLVVSIVNTSLWKDTERFEVIR